LGGRQEGKRLALTDDFVADSLYFSLDDLKYRVGSFVNQACDSSATATDDYAVLSIGSCHVHGALLELRRAWIDLECGRCRGAKSWVWYGARFTQKLVRKCRLQASLLRHLATRRDRAGMSEYSLYTLRTLIARASPAISTDPIKRSANSSHEALRLALAEFGAVASFSQARFGLCCKKFTNCLLTIL